MPAVKVWAQGFRAGHAAGWVAGARGESHDAFDVPPMPAELQGGAIESRLGRIIGLAVVVSVSVVLLFMAVGAVILGARVLGGLIA